MGEREPRVHYSSCVDFSKINIEPLRHGFMNVHLGFLNVYRRYHVVFRIPWDRCDHQKNEDFAPAAIPYGERNRYCDITGLWAEADGILRVEMELFVKEQQFMKEEIKISCCGALGNPLTLILRARIFGENEGEALLRTGIVQIKETCTTNQIAVDHDDQFNTVDVYLGFLNFHNKYRVELSIPWNDCSHQKDSVFSPLAVPYEDKENPNCRATKFFKEKDNTLRLTIELYVDDPDFLQDHLEISCCKEGKKITLYFRARILSEEDGFPMLRRGVTPVEEAQASQPDDESNKIKVELVRLGCADIHLGSLRMRHRYQAYFEIPWTGCLHRRDTSLPPAIPYGEQNSYCYIMSLVRQENGLMGVTVEMYIIARKFWKENLQISCCSVGPPFTITMRAKILGLDEGQPTLRTGVRLIRASRSSQSSDASSGKNDN